MELARENGVGIISLTDHDTVAGVAEAIAAGAEFGVRVIPGVEITTVFHGKNIHILGYGVRAADETFRQFLDPIFHFRRENLFRKLELINTDLRNQGKKIVDLEDFQKSQGTFFNTPNAAAYLAKNGFAENKDAAFMLLRSAVVPALDVHPGDAIKAIHAAGGLAVLSHPFAPKISLKNIAAKEGDEETLFGELVKLGLDGIECFQSGHTKEDTARALALAERHGLLVTGGSDWHGSLAVLGEDIKDYIPHYPERLGEIDIPEESVAPFLAALKVDNP